jgi:ATP-dependent Clp protease ATP-binding subunit ClpA
MSESFTDEARKAVVWAAEEARVFNSDYIGTEHLLLALFRQDNTASAQALKSFGIGPQDLYDAVAHSRGFGMVPYAGQLDFTPSAQNALERTSHEASQLGHDYIGTGHILLSLIAATEGDSSTLLTSLSGSNSEELRRDTLNYLADYQSLEQARGRRHSCA